MRINDLLQYGTVHCLVEEILLACYEKDDQTHVDVMVVGLFSVDSASVECLQYWNHQLLNLSSSQNITSELVVPVEQQVEQQRGLLSVESAGECGVERRILQSELSTRVHTLL